MVCSPPCNMTSACHMQSPAGSPAFVATTAFAAFLLKLPCYRSYSVSLRPDNRQTDQQHYQHVSAYVSAVTPLIQHVHSCWHTDLLLVTPSHRRISVSLAFLAAAGLLAAAGPAYTVGLASRAAQSRVL